MVELKCSEIIEGKFDIVPTVDLSVRQYQDQPRILYIGQGSQVIQIPETELEKFVEFLNKAKTLPLTEIHLGWLR